MFSAKQGHYWLRACGVLMVKILIKCILSILVYNLFYRQTAQYFHTRYLGCLHENDIHFFKKYGYLIG